MARFVSVETHEVRAEWWDEGETVSIRKLSYLDRQYISAEATLYTRGEENGHRVIGVDTEAMDRAILERGIASWTLRDENGKAAPLTRSAIERLSLEDGRFIVNAIHEYNPRRSAAEQEGFRPAAGDGAAPG